VEANRDEFINRQRSKKAGRIINHLDTWLGRPATAADVSDWREAQWMRLFARYNEKWNRANPWPTVDMTIAKLRVRDKTAARRAQLVG
jgi:hypothetical protein